jgi:hypothetical protein
MRLSRSMRTEAVLACGFVMTALVLAASNSVAEAGGSSTVTRHLTLHHEPFDPRDRTGPSDADFLLAAFVRILCSGSKEARDRWTEPESGRLRVWLYRQWRLTHEAGPPVIASEAKQSKV